MIIITLTLGQAANDVSAALEEVFNNMTSTSAFNMTLDNFDPTVVSEDILSRMPIGTTNAEQ
jgi:hypothetical protein